MSFMIYTGEKEIGDLLRRAYGELKPQDAKRAEIALRKANPQLANLGEIQAGAVIVVPLLPGLAAAPAAGNGEPAGEAVAAVRAALEDYGEQLAAALVAERASIKAATTLAESQELRKLSSDAQRYISQAAVALKQRSTDAAQAADLLKLLVNVQKDLAALAEKLADGS